MADLMDPRLLTEHPANQRIYGCSPVDDLVESIRLHGVLEPLVVNDAGTIISGHRRHRAALALDLKVIPVAVQQFQDEICSLIEFNRYRQKTWSQIYAECRILMPRLKEAAVERRRAGARAGAARRHGGLPVRAAHRSRVIDDLERCTGVNRERLRRLLRIHEAVEAGLAPKELVDRLDGGDLTMHQAYRVLRKQQRIERRQNELDADTAAGRYNVKELISPFDVWDFKRRDLRFGRTGTPEELLDSRFGAPPPQVLVNLVHHFTDEGDHVIDPMAGNGTMADVCQYMKRDCTCSDLNPRRPGILQRDAMIGPPEEMLRLADLLFLDPPYGDQYRYSDDPRDLCNAPTPESFLACLDRVLALWLPTVKKGGRVALMVGSEFRKGRVLDRAWEAGKLLERRATIERRIHTPHAPVMFPAYRVAKAVDGRKMLSRICELFVARPH